MFKVKCKYCGEKNSKHDQYCYSCGSNLSAVKKTNRPNLSYAEKKVKIDSLLNHHQNSDQDTSNDDQKNNEHFHPVDEKRYTRTETNETIYKGHPVIYNDIESIERQVYNLLSSINAEQLIILKTPTTNEPKYIIKRNDPATQDETSFLFQLIDISHNENMTIPVLFNLNHLDNAINIRQYKVQTDNTVILLIQKVYYLYDLDKKSFKKIAPTKESLPKSYKDISISLNIFAWEGDIRFKIEHITYSSTGQHSKTRNTYTLYKNYFDETEKNQNDQLLILNKENDDHFFGYYFENVPSDVYFKKLLSTVNIDKPIILNKITSHQSEFMIKKHKDSCKNMTHLPFCIVDVSTDKKFNVPILCHLKTLEEAINVREYYDDEATGVIFVNNVYYLYDFDEETFSQIEPEEHSLPKFYKDISISYDSIIWESELRLKMNLVIYHSNGHYETFRNSYRVG